MTDLHVKHEICSLVGEEGASVLLEVGEAKVSFSEQRPEPEVRKVGT